MQLQCQELDFGCLVELCTKLCLQACMMVKDCLQNKQTKSFMKTPLDPVTEADLKVQTMLIRGLKHIYPKLKIVGEEDIEYQGQIKTDYESLPNIEIPQKFKLQKKYLIDSLCVWIDPIDNTNGFINGLLGEVTVLIGISYNNMAQVGIIGVPFRKQGDQYIHEPTILIGCSSEHFAMEYKSKQNKWSDLKKHQSKQAKVITMSATKKNPIQKQIMDELKMTKLSAGGAGYKVALVVKGEADLFIYCDPLTKRWDSCCGDAIMKALGGYFLNTRGENIQYIYGEPSYVNKEGFLCCFDDKIKQFCLKVCKRY